MVFNLVFASFAIDDFIHALVVPVPASENPWAQATYEDGHDYTDGVDDVAEVAHVAIIANDGH